MGLTLAAVLLVLHAVSRVSALTRSHCWPLTATVRLLQDCPRLLSRFPFQPTFVRAHKCNVLQYMLGGMLLSAFLVQSYLQFQHTSSRRL